MSDLWEYVRDRWEWDSAWKDQIILSVLVGLIGLSFATVEVLMRKGVVARGRD